jgi:CBS domain-containing protein
LHSIRADREGEDQAISIETYAVTDVVSVAPDHTLAESIELMRSKKVGSVVVAREGRPVGMLTDRDAALAVHAQGLDPVRTRVEGVMHAPLITLERGSGLRPAIRSMAEHGVRRLPIVDADGKLAGIVAADDLLLVIARELFLLRSPLVAQRAKLQTAHAEPASRALHEHYRREVVSVAPEATPAEIARALQHEAVGAVIVADARRRPLGIITDRDLATRAPLSAGATSTARDLMSAPLALVEARADLEEVIHVMQQRSVRRLPVVEAGELVGIVTLDDLLVLLGRELADLGVAIRHSIERARRSERLQNLRARLHETIDWSLDRAEVLGEKAQERLSRDLQAIRDQLQRRLS